MSDAAHDFASIPPPRRVRQRGKVSTQLVRKLLLVPHALVGAGMLAYTIFLVSLVGFGTTGRGEITAKRVRVNRDSTFVVEFSYEVHGRRYIQSASLPEAEFAQTSNGDSIGVRFNALVPGLGSFLASEDRSGQLILLISFTLFWNGIFGTFAWFLVVKPSRRRRLVVNGIGVTGKITAKEFFRHGAGGTAVVRFTYLVEELRSSAAKEYTGRMVVQPSEAEVLNEGDDTVILYDRRAPARSVIYVLSGFEIVPPGEH
jgi:hypothetical protein